MDDIRLVSKFVPPPPDESPVHELKRMFSKTELSDRIDDMCLKKATGSKSDLALRLAYLETGALSKDDVKMEFNVKQ